MNIFRRKLGELPSARVAEIREVLLDVARGLAKFGVQAVPFNEGEPILLREMKEADVEWLLTNWRAYSQVLGELAQAQRTEGAEQTRGLLWRMLARVGYAPQPETLGLIEDEDIVEIYDLKNRQIFRSLKFFEFSSFTLEELFSGDWIRLTTREASVVERALTNIAMIRAGLTNRVLNLMELFDEHLVKENVGRRNQFYVKLRFASPLRRRGLPLAFLIIQRPRWP